MYKIITAIIFLWVSLLSMNGQAYDTLRYRNRSVVIDTTGFIELSIPNLKQEEDPPYRMIHYVYKREYTAVTHSCQSASYILVYLGHPLTSYFHPGTVYEVYDNGNNQYGGTSIRAKSDGLFYRYDTFLDGYVGVAYYFVREEDLNVFDNVLNKIILLDNKIVD